MQSQPHCRQLGNFVRKNKRAHSYHALLVTVTTCGSTISSRVHALPSMQAELNDKLPSNSSWIYFPMVKLRTIGFLAIVLVGLLFSSCAARPRRAAISGPAPAGAAELKITQSIIPPEKCGRPLHRPMRPTFI